MMAFPQDESDIAGQHRPKTELRRMWINQPSTTQPLHRLHGMRVLARLEYDHTYRAYPVEGDTESLMVPSLCLSEGWPAPSKVQVWVREGDFDGLDEVPGGEAIYAYKGFKPFEGYVAITKLTK